MMIMSMSSRVLFVSILATATCVAAFAVVPSNQQQPRATRFPAGAIIVAPASSSSKSEPVLKASADTNNNDIAEASSFVDEMQLLQDAIGYNVTAASVLLSRINQLRDEKQFTVMELLLNELLQQGPDLRRNAKWWTRSKRLARVSRRARMASLARMLDQSTDSASSSEDPKTKEQELQKRRRALVAVLRNLASQDENDAPETKKQPAIVALERKAIRASKETNVQDLRRRLPEGLETPNYSVVDTITHSGTTLEIRKYDPYAVCAVSMSRPRPVAAEKTDAKVQMPELNGASSFGALAGYLFGKNDQSTAMKMTTPVFTTTTTTLEDKDKQMEFVLPSEFWTKDGTTQAPQPLEGSGVRLETKPSEYRAVLLFGGYATPKETEKRMAQLKAALGKDTKQWTMVEGEEVALAQYNDPFTVPWKRLNEVSIQVVQQQSQETNSQENKNVGDMGNGGVGGGGGSPNTRSSTALNAVAPATRAAPTTRTAASLGVVTGLATRPCIRRACQTMTLSATATTPKSTMLSLRGGAMVAVAATSAPAVTVWLGPAMACAMAYALYNLFIKKASASIDPILGGVLLQIVAAVLGAVLLGVQQFSAAQTVTTNGAAAVALKLSKVGVAWAVAAGAAVGSAEILSFIISSLGVPASQSIPTIVGGSVVFGTVIGALWLGERLSPKGWMGIVLIAVGIAMVGMDPGASLH